MPQIEVKFDIDANGIFNVSAKDKASGKSQSIKIEGSSSIPQEEIEKMKKEAELHSEEDKKKKDLITEKNVAETLIYTCEKTLKDAGDKVNPELKKEIEDKVAELRKAKEGDSIEEIKEKSNQLSQAIQKAGAQMHKQAPQEPKPSDPKDTEEGEFKEKEE